MRPWLLTPLLNPVTQQELRFNNHFKTARNIIERCIGVLKNRFRCLLKDRTLHYGPYKAGLIINACAILHNMCIEYNIPNPEDNVAVINFGNLINELENGINPDLAAARHLQQNIIQNHFN